MKVYNVRNKHILLAGVMGSMMISGQIYAADYCTDQPVSGIVYKIVSAGVDKLVAAESTAKKANVVSQKNTGSDSQRFILNQQSNGYWAIQASNTSYAATVEGGSKSNGATVQQKPYSSSLSQEWQLVQITSGTYQGTYKIINANSALLLTVAGSAEGADIYQNKDAGGSSQRWWLEPVTRTCGSSGSGSGSSSSADISSSSAAPTAAAARSAGANTEPLTNGYPSFIKHVNSNATVVSTLAGLLAAIDDASAGDVIYIRGGTYYPSETIKIQHSGSSSKAIVLSAYPGDARPVFDFSAMSEKSSNRGFQLNANYWHLYGFDIKKAGDNGMYLTGSHNTIEFMKFYENSDTGLQISSGAAYNFIKNSDSYYNADSTLENADGFAAKLTVGTGNYFYGCRAWNNLDDGFDGYLRDNGSSITTTLEYTWMIRNGYQKNGVKGAGDGNGFKTGGSDGKDLAHNGLYINTISAGNTADGYDQNSNRGTVTIYNAIAFGNDRNFGLGDGSSRQLKKLTVKNSISLDSGKSDKFGASSTSISNNSWQNGISFSSSDFSSVNINDLLADRQSDGSLPVVKFFHLKSGSKLIDAGTDVGLDYNGRAPDLGSFESK
ncbi:RICIN domain-containing protein [Vibrio mangrovi]|uniref:Pectate lyase L n=1 Tax=Vibrio mangrovi TaxID=474394 RepID=A0A1Y6IR89_9VIBR|nr:RICIN domain-containing protein [Vibrio mangrovi]MDW6001825.1 RICIN domain-containing protein [Vibrio mangrovi]SMS00148.1 Pectate lyase L precursor [Vibrio mangrovi]